jgi:hypothetical protein
MKWKPLVLAGFGPVDGIAVVDGQGWWVTEIAGVRVLSCSVIAAVNRSSSQNHVPWCRCEV